MPSALEINQSQRRTEGRNYKRPKLKRYPVSDPGAHQGDVLISLDGEVRHAKLGFQMRGIVNELYLDDLREKTLRGQLGQKARGFSVGEATYGYRSEPVGEMKVDRRGRPRPDGYRMVPYSTEAEIVRRIFRNSASGKALTAIVRELNQERVPGRRRTSLGWTPSTLSRMLKNEKYIGRWA
jgi:DNA invertase Pin-like site-specific DNA recombinase